MNFTAAIQEEIISEFELFDDWMDKYSYIIDLGKEFGGMLDREKKDHLLVKGCQSKVWLKSDFNAGIMNFKADSDAMITKGIVALLLKVLNQKAPREILDADLFFIEKIGLKAHLSMNRSNGLMAMIQRIKSDAEKHL